MIKKLKIIVSLSMVMILFFTGCWDYRDVEKRSLVISVGIDKVNDNIEFSSEIAKFTKQEKAKISEIYSDVSSGENFEAARVDFNNRRPYPSFLGTTRVVVFGQKYAKGGIKPYINRINKIYDYRKTLLAVVSKEPAQEILKVKPDNDTSAGFLIEHNIEYMSNMGYGLYTDIGEILSDIAMDNVGYILPYVGIYQKRIKYLGIAIMKDSKLIDTIPTSESDGLLYLLAKNPTLTEEIYSKKYDKNVYSFKVNRGKKNISTNYKNGKVIINIDLRLKSLLQYQYYNRSLDKAKLKQLENRISDKVKSDIDEIIKKTQKEYKCDICGFAKNFRADNNKIYKDINWKEKYPKAQININVKTNILNENLADFNAKKNK